MITHVMLVDDEAVTRQYFSQMELWQREEFSLRAAVASGEEALARLAIGDIDILLLDVYMPGMSGVMLSRQVAERFPQVAMVAVSNYDDYDYVREIMRNGAVDYLLKQRLDGDVLLSVLRKARDHASAPPRQMLRERIALWMEGRHVYPLPTDGARLGAIVFSLAERQDLPPGQRDIVLDGAVHLLERASTGESDCIAVLRPPRHFVLFTRLYNAVSAAEMQARMAMIAREATDMVQQIYHLSLTCDICGPMIDNQSLLSFVLHKVASGAQAEAPKRVALTIAQHKQLLQLMEGGNLPAAAQALREMLTQSFREDRQGFGITVKEVADILAHAAAEYGAAMPDCMQGVNLYRWMRECAPATQIEALVDVARGIMHRQLLLENRQYSPIVRGAMLCMQERYALPIGLAEIAEDLQCNASYLSRLFHQETGFTVIEYLTQVRIAEAKRLIGSVPLKQIAQRVGFAQYTYFLKVFKHETGMTPKQYIREHYARSGEKSK